MRRPLTTRQRRITVVIACDCCDAEWVQGDWERRSWGAHKARYHAERTGHTVEVRQVIRDIYARA